MPNLRTIEHWLGSSKNDPRERRPQGRLMNQHCKAGLHQRRFAVLMSENFRFTDDLETYAYNTQVLQAEAIGFAYRSWRREWRGPGKEYVSTRFLLPTQNIMLIHRSFGHVDCWCFGLAVERLLARDIMGTC
jgi:hypothetical protein